MPGAEGAAVLPESSPFCSGKRAIPDKILVKAHLMLANEKALY